MLSERSKRRKTEDILSKISMKDLYCATQMSLQSSGQSETAKVAKDVTIGDVKSAENYRRSVEFLPETTTCIEDYEDEP